MKIFMKPLLLITMVFLMCAFALAKEGNEKAPAPDFKLQDLSKNYVALSDYKGKNPIVIIFWTTWCHFCRAELNNLNQKYPQLAKEGWEVLAINVDEPPSLVEAFLKKHGLTFKVLFDRDSAVRSSYGVLGVPTVILVNKEGFVIYEDNYFPEGKYRELILK